MVTFTLNLLTLPVAPPPSLKPDVPIIEVGSVDWHLFCIFLAVVALLAIMAAFIFPLFAKDETEAKTLQSKPEVRQKAIKTEHLKLSLQLDQSHAIGQRMAELEEEYRKLQPGSPFRTVSLRDEFGKNKAVQLLKELEENGPLP